MNETSTMLRNEVPHYNTGDNPTDCCPRFKPEGWDGQLLHFKDKPFVLARSHSAMYIPLNMGSVFDRTCQAIEAAGAVEFGQFIALSRDVSPWTSEHLFVVTKPVGGQQMVNLTGEFRTKVFEGAYRKVRDWADEMRALAPNEPNPDVYFFYTTCPKCAREYGENYVVGFVRVA